MLRSSLAILALAVSLGSAQAQAPAPADLDPNNTIVLETKDGKVDDPPAPGPRSQACRADQGADQARLL